MSAKARAAAEALKSAIDRHLTACEQRSGESDPAVQDAYEALREAAQVYDDTLFEAYDEVTPFELAEAPGEPPVEVADPGAPETFTLLLRRDYDIVDPDALFAAGDEARTAGDGADVLAGENLDSDDVGEQIGRAVFELIRAYGVDGLTARSDEVGLEPVAGTMWLIDELEGAVEEQPFDGIDEQLLLFRIDEVYAD